MFRKLNVSEHDLLGWMEMVDVCYAACEYGLVSTGLTHPTFLLYCLTIKICYIEC
jgi:hypothetical protein